MKFAIHNHDGNSLALRNIQNSLLIYIGNRVAVFIKSSGVNPSTRIQIEKKTLTPPDLISK